MSACAHLFPAQKLLISKFEGTLTDALFTAYYSKLLSLPGDTSDFAELVDFRDVDKIEVTEASLQRVAAEVADLYDSIDKKMQCAVVAPTDLGFGLSRMYEGRNSPAFVELEVFRSVREALEWLDRLSEGFATELDNLGKDGPSAVFHLAE